MNASVTQKKKKKDPLYAWIPTFLWESEDEIRTTRYLISLFCERESRLIEILFRNYDKKRFASRIIVNKGQSENTAKRTSMLCVSRICVFVEACSWLFEEYLNFFDTWNLMKGDIRGGTQNHQRFYQLKPNGDLSCCFWIHKSIFGISTLA